MRRDAHTGLALIDADGRLLVAHPDFREAVTREWGVDGPSGLPWTLMRPPPDGGPLVVTGLTLRATVRQVRTYRLVEFRSVSPIDRLPPQRARITWAFHDGHSHKAIARRMGLAPATVRNQLRQAYTDLGIHDKRALAALADLACRLDVAEGDDGRAPRGALDIGSDAPQAPFLAGPMRGTVSTHRDELLSQRIVDLYREAQERPSSEFPGYAVGLVSQVFPFQSAIFGVADRRSKSQPHVLASETIGIDPVSLDEWMAHGLQHLDPIARIAAEHPWITLTVRARSAFARRDWQPLLDFAMRHGREHFLTTSVPADASDRFHWFSLYRARPDDAFDPDAVRLCRSLLPHVAEAMHVNRVIRGSSDSLDAADRKSRVAFAIATDQGVLQAGDPAFHRAMSREWTQFDASRLPGALLASVHATESGRYIGAHIVVTHRRRAGLVLLQCRTRHPLDTLSPQRARVADLYAQGLTNRDVAAALGLAAATVRNHLSALYTELRIGSRNELIALTEDRPPD